MATITPQSAVDADGAAITFAAASGGGDVIDAGGEHVSLRIKNGDASSHTVTLSCPNACSFGLVSSAHDLAIAVAAGAEEDVEIPARCVDPATGHVAVSYSAVTSVTIAAVLD